MADERKCIMAKKILILDDDPHIVDYLKDVFQENGYETITASDGKEGIDKVIEGKPDLITLDVEMPERWGTIFHRIMTRKEGFKDIPVIVISGIDTIKKLERSEGVVAYLSKPFDRDELLKIVKKTIGGASE
jgi:CheY-like chemotaxis protein